MKSTPASDPPRYALPEADVDGQLQRLRPGEHVAEVERADEFLLAHPAAALHAIQVHQADLGDRPAERQPPQLEEVPAQSRRDVWSAPAASVTLLTPGGYSGTST